MWGDTKSDKLDVSINKEKIVMTKSMRAAVMGAALAGFLAGTTGLAQDQSSAPAQTEGKKSTKKAKVEKHACKGQNSCKGNGGCKSGDNGCKGKNSCKGKGGCATDGKTKMPE